MTQTQRLDEPQFAARWRRLSFAISLMVLLLFACGDKEELPVLDCDPQLTAQATSYALDIEPIISSNCLVCHTSEATGGGRFGAPVDANFETYDLAAEWAAPMFERAVQGTMPPPEAGLDLLEERELCLIRDWIDDGLPQ